MKEAFKNNKKVIIIAVAIIVLLSLGITYAYLTTTLHGKEEYMVRAGSLGLRLEESNELTLEKQIPLEDSEGMKLDGFNFSLINEGNIDTDFTIYLDDIELDEGETRMPDSAIRYSLTKDSVVGNASDLTSMGVNPNRVVDTGTVAVDETINYTLRIWIDYDATTEEVSGKTFKAKFRVETSQHVIPETTKQLLANNEVKEEKENMFNYTSNGTYIDNYNDWNELTNPDYVTNGLYSMKDEDGVSYYFRGSNVNNFVQFGTYTQDYYVYRYDDIDFVTLDSCQYYNSSCSESNRILKYNAGTPMYWRIVRVNGDGSLRLIYNGTSTSATGQYLMIGNSAYNKNRDNPKYTGYTYDRDSNETDSIAKRDIEAWYNEVLAGTTYDNKITSGRFCSDSSGYKLASEYGNQGYSDVTYLYASSDRLDQASGTTAYAKPNAPALKCPSTTESYGGSYKLKVGLITADELVLSGMVPFMGTYTDSYLTSDWYYWSMSPADFNFGSAFSWAPAEALDSDIVNNGRDGLRPVINLTTDNGFASGSGTSSDTYVLQ